MEQISEAVKQFYADHFGVPADQVDARVAEVNAAATAAAELESKKQSLRDQITNLQNELDGLEPQVQG